MVRTLFEYSGTSRAVPLHEFGASGGFVNVTLDVMPATCSSEQLRELNTTQCWDELDHVYVGLFSYNQWANLTRSEVFLVGGAAAEVSCAHLEASALTCVSGLTWQQPTGACLSCFAPGEEEVWPPRDLTFEASMARNAEQLPLDGSPLRFTLRYVIPPAHDLYTLALWNCRGVDLSVAGEASFVGGRGEKLSTRDHSVLTVHLTFLGVTLSLANGLALLMRWNRQHALPLHGLLVVVLLLRVVPPATPTRARAGATSWCRATTARL